MSSSRWIRAIAEALPAALWAAAVAAPWRLVEAQPRARISPPAVATASADAAAITSLGNVLLGQGQTPADRASAAARLAATRSPAAAAILANALNSFDSDITSAAAKALSETDWADPQFVTPLEGLLGPSQTLNGYVAQALSLFADTPSSAGVETQLVAAATTDQIPASARAPLVRALGAFADKAVAQTLLNLLIDPSQGDDVRQASAVALAEMTGMSQFGQDARKWQMWWQSVRDLPDDELVAQMQRQRGAQFAQVIRQSDQLERSLDRLLKSLYFTSTAADQPRILDTYLTNDAPEVRKIGAQIVQIDVSGGRPMLPEARARLITMVADDPSADVRAAAAAALGLDPTAAGVLFDRLERETNPDVVAAVLSALASRQDPRLITIATRMLANSSSLIVEAAADAIAANGPLLIDPRQAALRKTVESALLADLDHTSASDSPLLRRHLTGALAALGDPALYDRFMELSSAAEPEAVRVEAVGGLGLLATQNPDIAGVLADFVDSDNMPAAIRLKAVQMLAGVPTTAYVDRLVDRLNRTPDPDPDIRAAIWQTVQAWFPLMDDTRLSNLAERLRNEHDYSREVDVRRYYVRQLDLRKTDDAQLAAASQLETIATRELNDLNLPTAAAADFASVVNYYLSHTPSPDDLPHNPFRAEAAALLAAGPPYDAAVQYGAQTLADPRRLPVVPDVLEQFPEYASKLATANPNDRTALNNALLLIQTFDDAKLKIPPSLSYVQDNMSAAADAAKQNLANLGGATQP